MYESIWTHQSINIRRISRNRAEQVAYYRFLENPDVTISELSQSLAIAVLDAETGFPLGISAVQLWTREANRSSKKKRKYYALPIEKKESFKWIASAERSAPSLEAGGATQITHIGDRESDIDEAWCQNLCNG